MSWMRSDPQGLECFGGRASGYGMRVRNVSLSIRLVFWKGMEARRRHREMERGSDYKT